MTYRPDEGKLYTVLERRGSPKLTEIVEKLLASEADASQAGKLADHEISPSNYVAVPSRYRNNSGTTPATSSISTPKRKSKYLIKGTAWVDREQL